RMMNWDLVPNGNFYYTSPTGIETMHVFRKMANKGRKVYIPMVGDFAGVIILAAEIEYSRPPIKVSKGSVIVEAEGFEKSTFQEDAKLWRNRDYIGVNVPKEFDGFDMLIQNAIKRGEKSPTQVIVPKTSGKVYAFARSTNHIKSVMINEKWSLVEGGDFNYNA